MQYTWIPFLIISLDQLTKRIATNWFFKEIEINYEFWLTIKSKIVWNKGISFSMFSDSYYNILIYLAIIISIGLVFASWYKAKEKTDIIAWGLIMGGGLSNLFDRWFFGAVLDFIAISFNQHNFPIFNFADMAITIGTIIISRKFLLFGKVNDKKIK